MQALWSRAQQPAPGASYMWHTLAFGVWSRVGRQTAQWQGVCRQALTVSTIGWHTPALVRQVVVGIVLTLSRA